MKSIIKDFSFGGKPKQNFRILLLMCFVTFFSFLSFLHSTNLQLDTINFSEQLDKDLIYNNGDNTLRTAKEETYVAYDGTKNIHDETIIADTNISDEKDNNNNIKNNEGRKPLINGLTEVIDLKSLVNKTAHLFGIDTSLPRVRLLYRGRP